MRKQSVDFRHDFGLQGHLGGLEGGFREELKVLLSLLHTSASACLGRAGAKVGVRGRCVTYTRGLQHAGQAWIVSHSRIENGEAGIQEVHAGAERGNAPLEGVVRGGVHGRSI